MLHNTSMWECESVFASRTDLTFGKGQGRLLRELGKFLFGTLHPVLCVFYSVFGIRMVLHETAVTEIN